MKNKQTLYLKIIGSIVISFVVVSLTSKQIFVANTPYLQKDIGYKLLAGITNIVKAPYVFLAKKPNPDKKKIETALKDVPYRSIAPGVYAKEDENVTLKSYKENEVEWVTITFDHNGKTYTIRYAKSDGPPNMDLVKKTLE